MLDQIINYVQSLQRQVENEQFLSMKLAVSIPGFTSTLTTSLPKRCFLLVHPIFHQLECHQI
ncbi:hypothetical protein Pint_34679 [Pistacia integerrima]|uniref:Uncharacterized protein n=1 Tax=Pistacia integerrima TaxID=434235 RepID=A0ACC0X730_9ROSI|nr:hypothetical protein Pint_34679 [Pistacia integerrima]